MSHSVSYKTAANLFYIASCCLAFLAIAADWSGKYHFSVSLQNRIHSYSQPSDQDLAIQKANELTRKGNISAMLGVIMACLALISLLLSKIMRCNRPLAIPILLLAAYLISALYIV